MLDDRYSTTINTFETIGNMGLTGSFCTQQSSEKVKNTYTNTLRQIFILVRTRQLAATVTETTPLVIMQHKNKIYQVLLEEEEAEKGMSKQGKVPTRHQGWQ